MKVSEIDWKRDRITISKDPGGRGVSSSPATSSGTHCYSSDTTTCFTSGTDEGYGVD
jgi:hypothetical protein